MLYPSKNLRKIKKQYSYQEGFSNKIKYFGLIEDGIMVNIDGSLMSSWWFRGDDLDSATAQQLQAVSAYINMALMHLDEGCVIHVDSICYQSTGYMDESDNYFSEAIFYLIDEERRKIYESEGLHYENAYVLTITWLPPADIVRKVGNLYLRSTGKKQLNRKMSMQDILDRYKKLINEVTNRLSSGFPFIKQLTNQEILTYLNRCITGNTTLVSVPKNPVFLQQILANQDFIADSYPKIGNKYIQTVSITGFPLESFPGVMNALNTIDFEYRWTTRFIFVRRDKAKKHIDKVIRFWAAGRMDVKGWISSSLNPSARVIENPDALMKEADAKEALGDISGNYVKAGFYTGTVTIFDENLELAIAKAEQIAQVFDVLGFKCKVEKLNAIEAYLGSLPADGYHNVRKATLNSLVLADLLPQTAIWTGLERHPCPFYERYNTPPLMITSSGLTPFRVNLHVDDLGHTLIVGPAGSGKSTLVAMLIAQQFRYKYAKVFAFDKSRSLLPLCYCANGDHYDLLSEQELTFQPLMPPKLINQDGTEHDLTSFIAWLQSWIEDLCKVNGVKIDVNKSKIIYEAICTVLSSKNQKRWRMDELHSALQGDKEVQNVIKQYTEMGQYKFFDGDHDSIKNSNFIVFEMEELMRSNNEALIFATLTYLFEKIKQQLTGSPTFIVLEEVWLFLKNPIFAEKIDEWLRTLRKANVAVILITQSINEIINSSIGSVILDQCPTKIFLANPNAMNPNTYSVYESIGLQSTEIEIISNLVRKQDYYFVNPLGRRVFSLNMSRETTPIALTVLGKSSMDEIKEAILIKNQEPNKFTSAWLKHWGYEQPAKQWLDLANNKFSGINNV